MMTDENNNVPNSNSLTSRPPLGIADETHICTRGKERKLDTTTVVLVSSSTLATSTLIKLFVKMF
jgi:hypothetical protein